MTPIDRCLFLLLMFLCLPLINRFCKFWLLLKEDDYSKKNPDYVAEDLAFMSDFAISQLCSKYHSTQKYCLDGDIALESGKFKELDKILPQVKEKVGLWSQFFFLHSAHYVMV